MPRSVPRSARISRLAVLATLGVISLIAVGFIGTQSFRFNGTALRDGGTANETGSVTEPIGGVMETTPSRFSFDSSTLRPASLEALLAEVEEVTDQLIACVPDHPDSLEILARVQYWRGHSDAAVKLWKRCLQLDPVYGHAFSGMGMAAAKRGEFDVAAGFFRKALLLNPTSTETQIALGEAFINAGKPQLAISTLDQNVEANSPSAKRSSLLGQAYLQLQDFEKAKQHYQTARKLDPDSADICFGLATCCTRLGQKSQAAEWMARFQQLRAVERERRRSEKQNYDDLNASYQDVATKYTDAGRVFLAHGFPRQAETVWKRAATLSPQDMGSRQTLVWFYRQTNRTREAIAILKELAAIDPGSTQYHLEIGHLFAELGDVKGAEDAFLNVLKVAPQSPDGCAALAKLYLATRQKPHETVTLARQAVAAVPNAPNYALLSEACEFDGDTAGALSAIRSAAVADPANAAYRQRFHVLQVEK